MFNNIFGILEQFGFGTQKRAISIQFSNLALDSQIMLQRIDCQQNLSVYRRIHSSNSNNSLAVRWQWIKWQIQVSCLERQELLQVQAKVNQMVLLVFIA